MEFFFFLYLYLKLFFAYKYLRKIANKSNAYFDIDIENNIDNNIEKIQIIENNDDRKSEIYNNNLYDVNYALFSNDVPTNNNDEESIKINILYNIQNNKYNLYIRDIDGYNLLQTLIDYNIDNEKLNILYNFIEKIQFKQKID